MQMRYQQPNTTILLISLLVNIALFGYIISFILKLEQTGCKCSKDWRRDYILFYCIYTIATLATQLLYPATMKYLAPVSMILGLLFIIFTLQYVHELKEKKCLCSDNTGRFVLYLVAIIDAAVFAVAFLSFIVLAASATRLK
jgi:hypothetical protein